LVLILGQTALCSEVGENQVILHVVDTDGNQLYVTDLNAIDAATGQPRVVFVDPAAGKTYVHLYSDFFKVVRVTNEDGDEVEVPQYQVQGLVDAVPSSHGQDPSKRAQKRRRMERGGAQAEPNQELARPVAPYVAVGTEMDDQEAESAT
jgi:hypothetical protein